MVPTSSAPGLQYLPALGVQVSWPPSLPQSLASQALALPSELKSFLIFEPSDFGLLYSTHQKPDRLGSLSCALSPCTHPVLLKLRQLGTAVSRVTLHPDAYTCPVEFCTATMP